MAQAANMMASLEEENEVLLARYCVVSFLPTTLGAVATSTTTTTTTTTMLTPDHASSSSSSTADTNDMDMGMKTFFSFRPRWLPEPYPVTCSALPAGDILADGPSSSEEEENECRIITMPSAGQTDDRHGGLVDHVKKEEGAEEWTHHYHQHHQQQQTSPLLDLPEELLWLVWELARPTPEELCRWSLVCRRFDRVACGHLGLWLPFLPTTDLHSLLAFTSLHGHHDQCSSTSAMLLNPKELYRAGRRSQYDRLVKRIDSWGQAVLDATSFDEGELPDEPAEEKVTAESPKPLELFRDVFTYIQRTPIEPLDSFRMFLWRKVLQSLRIPTSATMEMDVMSTPSTPLPMISVRFTPLPRRSPVIKYVIVWHLFPFHEPKITAVDSEVYGIPPLPEYLRLKPMKGMIKFRSTTDHLKKVIDMKMDRIQQMVDGLFAFIESHIHMVDSQPQQKPSSCLLS